MTSTGYDDGDDELGGAVEPRVGGVLDDLLGTVVDDVRGLGLGGALDALELADEPAAVSG